MKRLNLNRLAAPASMLPLLLSASAAWGHSGGWYSEDGSDGLQEVWRHEDGKLYAQAGLAATWRDGGWPEDLWYQIPGVLMGGHAEAPEQGFSLDEASVALQWQHKRGLLAALEAGTHHGDELTLEQAWVGWQLPLSDGLRAQFQAGRLKGLFSPENATHASRRPFSETNAVYDAFYGGHLVDEGLRLQLLWEGVTAGLEIWDGGHFPATSGKGGGAQDLYIQWGQQWSGLRTDLGAWFYHARADERVDDRLDAGHSHGSGDDEDLEARQDIAFDGSQQGLGAFLFLSGDHRWNGDWGLRLELQGMDVDGELRDTTRQAALDGDYSAWTIQPEWGWGKHRLAARYSRLILENHLVGPGGPGLAEDAGLNGFGSDPWQAGLSYRYRVGAGLGLRLEWTHQALTAESSHYLGAGVTWVPFPG